MPSLNLAQQPTFQSLLLATHPLFCDDEPSREVVWITGRRIRADHPSGWEGVTLTDSLNLAFDRFCRQKVAMGEERELIEEITEWRFRLPSESPRFESDVDAPWSEFAEFASNGEPTVYSTRPLQSIRAAARELGTSVRLFVGRREWRPGELEREWAEGRWLAAESTPDLMFGDLERLWSSIVRRSWAEVTGVPTSPKCAAALATRI